MTAEGTLWSQGQLNVEKAGRARWAHRRIGVSDASGQVDLDRRRVEEQGEERRMVWLG